MPSVTVLMSVCNCRRYVRQAVESILGQTYTDYEFLIVEDGSNDGSDAILDDYAGRDPRIRILRNNENAGLIRSLNRGLEEARGAFVARMDADDVAFPKRLEKQVAHLQTHRDCVLLGSRVLSIDEDGDPICREHQKARHEDIERLLLCGIGGAVPHPTAMYRREDTVTAGGYREQYPACEDLDLWLRLAERGRLANLQEILLRYRRHFGSVCWQKYDLQKQSAEAALRDAYRRRGQNPPLDLMSRFMLKRTTLDERLHWSRLATHDGFYRTALKHALTALRTRPMNARAWQALLRILGHWSGIRHAACIC